MTPVREFGHFALSTLPGYSAFRYQVPLALSWATGMSYQEALAELDARLRERLAEEGRDRLSDDPFAASQQMMAVALEVAPRIGIVGLVRAWCVPMLINVFSPSLLGVPMVRELERPRIDRTAGEGTLGKVHAFLEGAAGSAFLRWVVAGALFTAALRLVQIVGLARIGRHGGLPIGPTLYLIAVCSYFLVVTGSHANVRYRLPLEPTLSVFLAAGLVWLVDVARDRKF